MLIKILKDAVEKTILVHLLIIAIVIVSCQTTTRNEPDQKGEPAQITIDYPIQESIFPPEFPAPEIIWRDADTNSAVWKISATFSNGSPSITAESPGVRLKVGDIDSSCIAPTNEIPTLTPQQAAAHTWRPDSAFWNRIKLHSIDKPVIIVLTGHSRKNPQRILSRGQVSIRTSRDSVGAPVFYRDVPLMPSESEKGVIKPLAPQAIPLIAWRIRDVSSQHSRLLMSGLHTCANCHSFSSDGKTLGMDMDGPLNDKGLYTIVKVQPKMIIKTEDQIEWSTFHGRLGNRLRVGFMSQVSPDGQAVITSVNDPGFTQTDYERRKDPKDLQHTYYVANFKDYRFLQVFYPTHGILGWYSPGTGHLTYLPGADDTNFVHANAVWSPDGKYLVFVRAKAQDAYPHGKQIAKCANDTDETQIRFDLYRIPFNNGKGGKAEPITGASQNGMSNSFPKVSPDGRWIVFVQARNGLLMRPDGKLYIVPSTGGTARLMKCNTPLMNSWHSFSPNGRWMVFSSKSRSPYTQMYLTHIDTAGEDSPPILIENAAAANRAVNIPEFVNIPPDGINTIETPAADFARYCDLAVEAMKNRLFERAVQEWKKALSLDSSNSWAHNNFGVALMETGQVDTAIDHYRKSVKMNPVYWEAYNNLGEALSQKGNFKEAVQQFQKAIQLNPKFTVARANLGAAMVQTGLLDEAIFHLKRAIEEDPDQPDARRNLGHLFAEKGKFQDASIQLGEAVRLTDGKDPFALFLLGCVYDELGRTEDAAILQNRALTLANQQNNTELVRTILIQLNNRHKNR
jgi:tetratricopeptide (TPR) repeat protein